MNDAAMLATALAGACPVDQGRAGHDWPARHGVEVVLLDDAECLALMREFVRDHPDIWNEDIGAG